MAITTPLNENQMWRLSALLKLEEEPLEAYFVDIDGTPLTKVALKFKDREESVYLTSQHYDIVRNGIKVTREAI